MSGEIILAMIGLMGSVVGMGVGAITALASRPKIKADAAETMTKAVDSLVTQVERLAQSVQNRDAMIDKRDARIDALEDDNKANRDVMGRLSDKIIALEKRLSDKDIVIGQLKGEIEKLKLAIAEKDKQGIALTESLNEQKSRVSVLELMMKDKDAEIARLQTQVATLEQEREADAKEIAELEAEKARFNSGNGVAIEMDKMPYASTDSPHPLTPSPLHGEGELSVIPTNTEGNKS